MGNTLGLLIKTGSNYILKEFKKEFFSQEEKRRKRRKKKKKKKKEFFSQVHIIMVYGRIILV
jgi:hypothetical protein